MEPGYAASALVRSGRQWTEKEVKHSHPPPCYLTPALFILKMRAPIPRAMVEDSAHLHITGISLHREVYVKEN